MKIRNPKNDKIKSNSQQNRIFEQKLKCIHEDCGDLLTIFYGHIASRKIARSAVGEFYLYDSHLSLDLLTS